MVSDDQHHTHQDRRHQVMILEWITYKKHRHDITSHSLYYSTTTTHARTRPPFPPEISFLSWTIPNYVFGGPGTFVARIIDWKKSGMRAKYDDRNHLSHSHFPRFSLSRPGARVRCPSFSLTVGHQTQTKQMSTIRYFFEGIKPNTA